MFRTCSLSLAVAVVLGLTGAGPFWKPKPISPEYQAMVSDWFARYLGRPADARSMETWGRKLMLGDDPREVEAAILGSKEYFLRNGGSNPAFILALHRDVLGTQPVGRQGEYWLKKLNDLEYRDELAEHFLKAAGKAGMLSPLPLACIAPPVIVLPPGAVPFPGSAYPPPAIPTLEIPPPITTSQYPTLPAPRLVPQPQP